MAPPASPIHPMSDVDDWQEVPRRRYASGEKRFRDYRGEVKPGVREFYRQNHAFQTYDFVQAKKREYGALDRRRMGVWEAMEFLNELVDDSDPDTELSQIDHLLQTAEAIRRDGHPDWFILTGLIHDLGKILCLWGEPQWAVVGDTFPVGCAYAGEVVFPEFFDANPDRSDSRFQTADGVYARHGGLENIHLSWGHDEYLYSVVKDRLPDEALSMIRYHSFYSWHAEGAYRHLMSPQDEERLRWAQAFQPYDLYSKAEAKPDAAALEPFYREVIDRYLPGELRW